MLEDLVNIHSTSPVVYAIGATITMLLGCYAVSRIDPMRQTTIGSSPVDARNTGTGITVAAVVAVFWHVLLTIVVVVSFLLVCIAGPFVFAAGCVAFFSLMQCETKAQKQAEKHRR